MGLFDFLDARVTVARWAAKWFHEGRKQGHTDSDIIAAALNNRYQTIGLNSDQAAMLRVKHAQATDIHTLCHLIAEIELLNHLDLMDRMTLQMGGEGIVEHTYGVMDRELQRLGF